MADDNESYLSLLADQKKGNDSSLTTQDVSDPSLYGLNPSQVQMFNTYQQALGPTQSHQMNPTDYYPDLYHNVGVGSYSGPHIGSATLFAPGGGLVPLGMLDSRDAAIRNAALKKAKEVDDWNKLHKSPSTKHVAVQEQLTDAYFNGLNQFRASAMKKANNDPWMANKLLDNDPTFQQWNQGMQDRAKFHDAIVNHAAELEKDEKNPEMVLSPETRKSYSDMMSGLAYQEHDPFNKEGQEVGKKFLASKAMYDLDKAVNVSLEKATPNIDPQALQFQGRGKNEIAIDLEKEYFPEQRLKELAHDTYMSKFYGTGVTEDQILKRMQAIKGEKITRKLAHYDFAHKEEGDDYNENDIVKEPTSTNVFTRNQNGPGGTVNVSSGTVESDYGVTHKKPIPAIVPNGAHVYINDTNQGLLKTSEVKANSKVQLFKTQLMKVAAGAGGHTGTPVSEEQITKGVKWKWDVMTSGIVTEKNDENHDVQKEIFVPAKEVENVLVRKRDKDGNVTKGIPVDKQYAEAEKRNKEMAPAAAPIQAATEVERQAKDGKIAIFDSNTKKFIRWK